MNKLLTTITLLCFSVTANADIYVCSTKAQASILDPSISGTDSLRIIGTNNDEDSTSYIVDTDQGVRTVFSDSTQALLSGTVANLEGNYRGSCETFTYLIRCSDSSYFDNMSHLLIDTQAKIFLRTSLNMFTGTQSQGGTCIKI